MKDVAVLKELAVKNKELYLYNLDLDIESYVKLLNTSTINTVKRMAKELIAVILNIENSYYRKMYIEETVRDFMNSFLNYVLKLYNDRETKLKLIKEEHNYINYLNETNEEQMKEYFNSNALSLVSLIGENYNNRDYIQLGYYIRDIFLKGLLKRLVNINENANDILLNSYCENVRHYELINKRTIR